MPPLIHILQGIGYPILFVIFWKIYPYTLSMIDRMEGNPIGEFFSRLGFALIAPIVAYFAGIFFVGFLIAIWQGA